MTHYPKFFLNKGRILALWVMYKIQKNGNFFRETFPNPIPNFVILDHKDTLLLLEIRQLVLSK